MNAAVMIGAVLFAGVAVWVLLHDVHRPDLDPWIPPRRAVADVVGIGSVECRCGAVRIEAVGEIRSAAAVCPICGQSLEVIGS